MTQPENGNIPQLETPDSKKSDEKSSSYTECNPYLNKTPSEDMTETSFSISLDDDILPLSGQTSSDTLPKPVHARLPSLPKNTQNPNSNPLKRKYEESLQKNTDTNTTVINDAVMNRIKRNDNKNLVKEDKLKNANTSKDSTPKDNVIDIDSTINSVTNKTTDSIKETSPIFNHASYKQHHKKPLTKKTSNRKLSNKEFLNNEPSNNEPLHKPSSHPSKPISLDPVDADSSKKEKRKPSFSFPLLVILLLVGLVVCAGVIFSMSKNSYIEKSSSPVGETPKTSSGDKKSQPEAPVLSVEVIQPKLSKVSTNISADGTVTAKNTASVSSKVNGMAIEKVLVEEGQWVNKGDLLAIFDAKSIRQNVIQSEARVRQSEAGVRQSEASVRQAEVSLAKAKADLNRVLPLLEIDAVSQQEVDNYRIQVQQAEANQMSVQANQASAQASMISAKAQFNSQKINFQDTKLLSPVSGIISKKTAHVGAIPQGSLFTIIEEGRLEWKAELHPEQVSQLKVGMPVVVTLNTDGNDKQIIRGKVSRIDPVANASRQIPVYVTLEAKEGIQSGMLLTGQFVVGTQTQIIVPVSAVVGNDGYDYLMTVNEIKSNKITEGERKGKTEMIGRVQRIKVEIGQQYGDAVTLKTQIKPTPIVRQGGSFLSDGDLVRVVGLENSNMKITKGQ